MDVTDNGSVLAASGFGNVTYSNFESTQVWGAKEKIVDNSDPLATDDTSGFAPGSFALDPMIADRVPYQGTQHVAPIGAANPASWTFANVPNGTYVVAVTYSKDISGQASNALYRVYNGSGANTLAASWAVTQKADPSFYTQYGSEWLPIAVVSVTDRRLKVTLSAGTDGEAAADAVRIDPVSAVKIVDNGDVGYSTFGTVNRVSPTHVQGVLDDYDWIASSNSSSSASWTVSGLNANQPYLVSASWVPSSANSQAARYRIFDAGSNTALGTVTVSQALAPSSFSEAHLNWQNLGVFTPTSGSLRVTVDSPSASNSRVIADAIRVSESAQLEISGLSFGALNFGKTPLGENVLRSATLTNRGPGALQLGTPVLVDGLANNFDYSGLFSLLGVGATTLPPGASTTVDVRLNAIWNGAYQGGTVTIPTNDAASRSAVIKLQGAVGAAAAPIAMIIDNEDPGFSLVSGSFVYWTGQGYGSDVRFNASYTDSQRETAQWLFSGLEAGTYQVAATWYPHSNRASNAPYKLNSGTDIVVNQKAAPASFTADGAAWQVLGTVTIGANQSLTVSLSDKLNGTASVNGYVIADAIRVVPVVPVVVIDDGDAGFSSSGNIVTWTGQGYGNNVRFNQSHSDTNQETFQWTFSNLPTGQYQVSATWYPHSNRATNAPYRINGGADVVVNQKAAPGSFTSGGTAWAILGTATVGAGGTLTVTLSDKLTNDTWANGYVIADAIQVTPLASVPVRVLDEVNEFLILNNGDRGTTCTNCTSWDFGQNLAYKREVFQLEGAWGTTTATWSAEVEPGVYQVAVSYSPHYTRGTDARYEVSTATQSRTFTVNQRLPATNNELGQGVVSIENTGFQVLTGTYTVPFGDASLTVTLRNNANAKVVADAVYIKRVAPLGLSPHCWRKRQLSVVSCQWSVVSCQWSVVRCLPLSRSPRLRVSPSPVSPSSPLTESQLSAAVVEATARWQASGLLTERQLAALATVETTIADLSGAQLGLASPGASRIWIDRDAAGRGWNAGSSQLTTDNGQLTCPGYDLLTAVMHELGHIAGYGHDDEIAGDLMNATLRAGAIQPGCRGRPVCRLVMANMAASAPRFFGSRMVKDVG